MEFIREEHVTGQREMETSGRNELETAREASLGVGRRVVVLIFFYSMLNA